jgi:hypothetical protein
MEQEPITITAEYKRQITVHLAVIECLLHPGTKRMTVVFGFDHCDGDIWLKVKDVVSGLGRATLMFLPPYKDFPAGQGNFFTDLGL